MAKGGIMQYLRGWAAKNIPTRESLSENRWLKPVAHRVLASELWRFTRRSVPRGMSVGLFAAFIIPVGQIPLAVLLALPFRGNVPIAIGATFLTNPFTFPFWIWLGNRTGRFLLQADSLTHGEVLQTQLDSWLGEWLFWLMDQAGVAAIGLAFIAVVSAILGYFVTDWAWNWWVGRKWQRRLAFRRRRAATIVGKAAQDD